MDIRDIKDRVPMIEDGSGMERMFGLQATLLQHYQEIEKMPPYPISLNSKKDQILLKDFIGRVTEEMAEAMESFLKMYEMCEANERDGIIPHLQNFNEEIGDSKHFLLETFIYINISAEDILDYYDVLLKKLNLHDAFWYGGKDLLKTCLALAKHINVHEGLYTSDYRIGAYTIIPDNELKDEFLRGGRSVSIPTLERLEILMWRVTYCLNISRNYLKNKPWKQTEMVTDSNRFQISMMEAWLAYYRVLDFIGMTPDSIFTVYFKKNMVNLFRIKSKY